MKSYFLLDHGLEPAPSRRRRMPWATFLKAHLGSIAATDFFTVEVLTLAGLARYCVLFVIDIETRRVQIAGIVRQPHGAWMKQIARNLTDHVDGFLWGTRYLIHDRDPLFTDEFRELLRALSPLALPPLARHGLPVASNCAGARAWESRGRSRKLAASIATTSGARLERSAQQRRASTSSPGVAPLGRPTLANTPSTALARLFSLACSSP